LENQLLPCGAPVIDVMRKLTVTNKTSACVDNNEVLGASARTCVPGIFGSAEVYGGGSEYFPFWQLPLWPFDLIRFLAQEEE